jgi:hypothetical protein
MPEGNEDKVWVVVDSDSAIEAAIAPPGDDDFEAQAGPLRALFGRKSKELDFGGLEKEWNQRLEQVDALTRAADAKANGKTGLRLTQIELGLTITAEGHLAFVASASASATLKVTFARS